MKNTYSLTSLKRWSCKPKEIPGIAAVKAIHVYDFDNTLFCSPLPNQQIWAAPTISQLQTYECFTHGGWWHDVNILKATGKGVEAEEPEAWKGHWNEQVVELARLSLESKDVVTVLLTGRDEERFSDIINRIANSKELDFDLVGLKPEVGPQGQRFESTMLFKQAFLFDLVHTYKNADEIRIYEDRPKHVKGFREYFERLNKSFLSHPVDQPAPPRKPITAEVIHVCELKATLDPDAEVRVIANAMALHNTNIRNGGPNPHKARNTLYRLNENFLYFGYLINQLDSMRLITLCANTVNPTQVDSGEVRYMASSILIAPFRVRDNTDIMRRVGGRGKKVTWQVTGLARFEDRIWAARVSPVSLGQTQIQTKDDPPVVVLAIRKGSRPIDAQKIVGWEAVPGEKALMFETTVGDKVLAELVPDDGGSNGRGNQNTNGNGNRRRVQGDGGYKRKFDEHSNQHQHQPQEQLRGKENWPRPGEKEDGGMRNGGGGGGAGNDRHGQGKYFNQSKANFNNKGNPNTPGGGQAKRGGADGGGGGGNNQRNRNASGPGGGGGSGGKHQNRRQAGGAGGQQGGGGSGRGPPGYKSLDDYGPAGFDGAGDGKGAESMGLNY